VLGIQLKQLSLDQLHQTNQRCISAVETKLRQSQSDRRTATGCCILRREQIHHARAHHHTRGAIRRILHDKAVVSLETKLHNCPTTPVPAFVVDAIEVYWLVASIDSVLVRVQSLVADCQERYLAVRNCIEFNRLSYVGSEGQ
jgi:hypothetical protein